MKKIMNTLIPVMIIMTGFGILFYPVISNYVYEHNTGIMLSVYEEEMKSESKEYYEALLKEASEYNEKLCQSQVTLTDPFIETKENGSSGTGMDYYKVLDPKGDGFMCIIDIPKIDVYLPVYHGTSEDVLQSGIGHIEGSSLPIGGISTHSVLSGHTGLNTAKLFTYLTSLEVGDYFFIHVLGEKLAYQIKEINVVEPYDISALRIRDGEDIVTLVTCTPYGMNTHRLLVTGERCEYSETVHENEKDKKPDEPNEWQKMYIKGITIGLAILLLIIIIIDFLHRI